MIQPVLSAIECWLAIFNNLPFSVRAFVSLSLAFFLLSGVTSVFRWGD